MKTKLALFGAGALVVAGALIYSLGIYPPASKRDTQGAIGQRDVYRDPQAHDANVTPGSAPVAASTNKPIQANVQNGVQNNVSRDVQSNVSRDVQSNVSRDVQSNVSRDVQSNVSRDVQSNLHQ